MPCRDESYDLREEYKTLHYELSAAEGEKMDGDLDTLRQVVRDFPVAELHEILVKSFALGNRSHLRFLLALLALEETRQYLLLGYSSIRQYAERNFGLGHTQTSELLRVARKLEALPESLSAFTGGKVSFSALKALTRIASPATEKAWLELASECSVRRLELEVADAIEKGRALPRDKNSGLPQRGFA
jgi:hypothetical protein